MAKQYTDGPLKVSGRTDPGKLAKSIVMTVQEREDGMVQIRSMGPHALNQAIKGLIIATSQLVAQGKNLAYRHGFETKQENGEDITLIVTTAWFYS